MIVTIALFILGFFVLIKSANFLIKQSSIIAKYLGIPSLIIGILIVGIGTSLPEFAVTFFSNIVGQNEIGMGTIVGSNIFNFLFILGLCAFSYPLFFKKEWVRRDMTWCAVSIIATLFTAVDGTITRIEGLVLLTLCVVWIVIVARHRDDAVQDSTTSHTIVIAFLLVMAGLVGVLMGSYLVVDGAVKIATDLGMSEMFVGLIIIGIGTSLPEITVSLAAARKREYGIAVGNVIGSNIFDYLGILGASALATPMFFEKGIIIELYISLAVVGIVTLLVVTARDYRLGRLQGSILIGLFFLYFVFTAIRG